MLETTTNIPKIAQEDIICYKTLKKVISRDSRLLRLVSYVREYVYVTDEENPVVELKTDGRLYTDVDSSSFYVVQEGYHSYQNYKEINPSENYDIYECVIPAGSVYFEDMYHKQYVSNKIIVTSKIIK